MKKTLAFLLSLLMSFSALSLSACDTKPKIPNNSFRFHIDIEDWERLSIDGFVVYRLYKNSNRAVGLWGSRDNEGNLVFENEEQGEEMTYTRSGMKYTIIDGQGESVDFQITGDKLKRSNIMEYEEEDVEPARLVFSGVYVKNADNQNDEYTEYLAISQATSIYNVFSVILSFDSESTGKMTLYSLARHMFDFDIKYALDGDRVYMTTANKDIYDKNQTDILDTTSVLTIKKNGLVMGLDSQNDVETTIAEQIQIAEILYERPLDFDTIFLKEI